MAFIFPSRCAFCKGFLLWEEHYICQGCWQKLDLTISPYCPRCGNPHWEDGQVCFQCQGRDYYFDSAMSVGWYEGVLKTAINLYKYKGKRQLAGPLGQLLISYWEIKRRNYSIDLIIPIPLHRRKRREREYNQSELLARRLGNYFKIPISCYNLVRVSYRLPQVGLSYRERWENVKGIFRVKNPWELSGKKILLIDDVYTTGATSNECSRILREAGAEKIWVLTLARG